MTETDYKHILDANGKLLPEIKELWITALRSGLYSQGYGQLVTEDGYCCLGVLAKELNDCARFTNDFLISMDEAVLPEQMADNDSAIRIGDSRVDWRDLKSIREFATQFGFTQGSVTALNDSFGWDFDMIAEWIETYY